MSRACAVTRLRMHQFRNYVDTTVHFHPGLNVISGSNAQGKTNLLEAVATLALARSPRTSSGAEVVRWGAAGCQVEADVSRPAGDLTLTTRFANAPGSETVVRRTLVDGKPRGARAVLGLCPVVLFWPDDLQLVKAGPEGRRRLLDVLLAQLDRAAAAHLVRFRKVLEQRNALLHHLRSNGGPAGALNGFTRELAHHGAHVEMARRRLLDRLAPQASTALHELSAGSEQLTLGYHASRDGGEETDDAERALLTALHARTGEELARGVSLVGPHRDDVDIELDGRPARHGASQGQQRSVVLACKIAEVRLVTEVSGMAPVVLLDDVVSELDAQRRRDLMRLLAAMPGLQVLLTTTEPTGDTAPFRDVHHFRVHAGTVTEAAR